MELRLLEVDLSVKEYDKLLHPITNPRSNYDRMLRRLQPYVSQELKMNKATRGIRIKIADPVLIEFCVRHCYPISHSGKKGGIKAGSNVATFKSRKKRSADEKARDSLGNAITGD